MRTISLNIEKDLDVSHTEGKQELNEIDSLKKTLEEKSKQLQSMLSDEEFESIDECESMLVEKMARLEELRAAGQGGIRKAKALEEEVEALRKIKLMQAEVDALHKDIEAAILAETKNQPNHTNELKAELDAKLQQLQLMLSDEALTSVEAFHVFLAERMRDLEQLIAEKKGEKNPAKRLREEIAHLSKIKTLVDEIDSLRESISLPYHGNSASVLAASSAEYAQEEIAVLHDDISALNVNYLPEEVGLELLKVLSLPNPGAGAVGGEIEIGFIEIELNEISSRYAAVLTILPECAEKSLSLLLAHFEYEFLKQKDEQKIYLNLAPLLNAEQVEIVLLRLKKQLDLEGLSNKQVNSSLEKITKLTVTHSKDSRKELVSEATKLLKYLQPVDLDLMQILMDKTESAAAYIKDKEIVLLLGITGVGKSTTIHFLAGSKLETTKVKGLRHIAYVVNELHPELKNFVTSPYPRSETRSINPIAINLSDLDPQMNGSIILCDSPGFGDTAGVEVDIANGVCLVKAISGARSVKPVILVSQKSIGDRLEGVKKLADILVHLMPSIRQQLHAFSYVFTKYKKKHSEEIHSKLKYKLQDLTREESSNDGFVALLGDMVQKTEKDAAIILDPINDKPVELLSVLFNRGVIDKPAENFKSYASMESIDKLKEQLNKSEHSFKQALRNGNIPLAIYKLSQIKKLSAQIDFFEVQKCYEGMLNATRALFSFTRQQIKNRLERIKAEGNAHVDEDFYRLKPEIIFLCRMEALRSQYLFNESNLIELMQNYILVFLKELISRVILNEDTLVREEKAIELNYVTSLLPKFGPDNLNKIKLSLICFSEIFINDTAFSERLRSERAEIFEYIQNLFCRYYESARKALDDYAFIKFFLYADQLFELQNYYHEYLGESAISQFKGLKADLDGLLQEMHLDVTRYFDGNSLEKKIDADVISKKINALNEMLKISGIEKYYDIQSIKNILEEAKAKIECFFICLHDKFLPTLFKLDHEKCFSGIHDMLIQIDSLRKNLLILEITQEVYFRIISCIRAYIEKIKIDVMHLLESGKQDDFSSSAKIDFRIIESGVLALHSAECLGEHSENIYDNELSEITKIIGKIVEKAKSQLMEPYSLNLEFIPIFRKQLIASNQLRNIGEIELILFGERAQSKQIIFEFDQRLKNIFCEIKKVCENGGFPKSPDELEVLFHFLEVCQPFIPEEFSFEVKNLWLQIEDVVKIRFEYLKNELCIAYGTIMSIFTSSPLEAAVLLEGVDEIVKNLLFLYSFKEKIEGYSRLKTDGPGIKEELREELFKKIPNLILDDWFSLNSGILVRYGKQLLQDAEEISQGRYDDRGLIKMELANKFKTLDKILPNGMPSFAEVSSRLEAALKTQSMSKVNALKLLAAQKDFDGFKQYYQNAISLQPKLREDFLVVLRELLPSLSQEIKKLSDKAFKLKLTPSSGPLLAEIISDLDRLLISAVIFDLEDSKNHEKELKELKQISNIIYEKIDLFFAETSRIISKGNLKSALNRIKFMQNVAAIFNGRSAKQEDLSLRSKRLEGDIRTKAQQRNAEYIAQDVADYAGSLPINYFKQLEDLAALDPYFSELLEQLTRAVLAKIIRAIEDCKQEAPEFDVDLRIKIIESLSPYIPLEIYSKSKALLEEVKKELSLRHHKEEQRCDDLKRAHDMEGLVKELMCSKNYSKMKLFSDQIIYLMKAENDNYKKTILAGNLKDIISPLIISWKGWLYYCEELKTKLVIVKSGYFFDTYGHMLDPKIPSAICQGMLDSITKEYKKTIAAVNSLSSFVPNNLDMAFEIITRYLPTLLKLFELRESFEKTRDQYKSPVKHIFHSLRDFYPDWSYSKFIEMLNIMGEIFLINQQAFNHAFEKNDFSALSQIMDLTEKYNATLEMLKDFPKGLTIRLSSSQKLIEFDMLLNYSDMRKNLAEKLIQLHQFSSQKILENHRAKSPNSLDRREFYLEISGAYLAFKTVKMLIKHVNERIADVNIAEIKSYDFILKHLVEVKNFTLSLVKAIPSANVRDITDINTWYDNLSIAAECFEGTNLVAESLAMIREIDSAIIERLALFEKEALSVCENSRLIEKLIYLKFMSIHAPAFRRLTDDLIDKLLSNVKRQKSGAQHIAALGIELNSVTGEHQSIAQMLIAEHETFKSYAVELRNEKTLRFGVNDVLKKLDSSSANVKLDVSMLEHSFKAYEELYWSLVEPGLLHIEKAKEEIICDVKLLTTSSEACEKKIVKFAAYLFAYWTLSNSNMIDDDLSKEERTYLLQPHSAQIISIFRLLGIDVPSYGIFENHLIEIGTGEGKSVIIAITAAILALMGYEVDCACYSDYLSQRDYQDFIPIFSAFGLRGYIQYGTFNKLSENLINRQADVREMVIGLIKTNSTAALKSHKAIRERIIIIDEVDVFFSADFYGNFYRPLAELHDETVDNLLSYIWMNRSNKKALRLNAVKSSDAFEACCKRFKGWEFLIEEATKAMIVDVQTFDSQEFIVQDDKIGYREQHGISFDISYGYKTIFAYFSKYEQGEITKSSRDARAALLIDCGSFSYAEIPKQYKCIMGVTGTLSTLSRPERDLLITVYGINKFTYMPSVYGDNKFIFAGDSARDVCIDQRSAHFMHITNEIKQRRQGAEIKRPVMVFFESNERLKEYYHSKELQKSGIDRDNVMLITEEIRDDQKAGLIHQAASDGKVTLLTRGFGRGTDFKSYDDRINKEGGVHVISTFVSDSISEERQIKGRTARQGNTGSFSMILAAEDLERYGLGSVEIKRMKDTSSFYSLINEKRCEFFEMQYNENLRYVDTIRTDHDVAIAFVSAIFNGRIEEIKSFLLSRNETIFSDGEGISRTICLMDATGSMSALLEKAKNTVHLMFERASEILKEKGIRSAFELQFVVYRNYNCKAEYLLQYSPWESDPDNLRQFMQTIKPRGGMGNEAIEIGLWHVNEELEKGSISQIILIGDMPPNTREEVIKKRRNGLKTSDDGSNCENYWAGTQFSVLTDHQEQLQRLTIRNDPVPIHAFYVKQSAMGSFQHIAQVTGGVSESLDIDSPEGAERLTQVVTERILDNLGGADLVAAYREKFVKKGYIASASKSSFFANTNSMGADSASHAANPPSKSFSLS